MDLKKLIISTLKLKKIVSKILKKKMKIHIISTLENYPLILMKAIKSYTPKINQV